MNTTLLIIQIVLAIILIAAILLQHSESGAGETFGGSDGGSPVATRRGIEKHIFQGTIVLAIVFVILSFAIFAIS